MHNEEASGTNTDPMPGVQATPTSPAEPVKLDEADLLKYQLLGSRVEASELKMTMYQRELHHAQIERENLRQSVAEHVRHIEAKYKTDLTQFVVSADGYLMPRLDPRLVQNGKRG